MRTVALGLLLGAVAHSDEHVDSVVNIIKQGGIVAVHDKISPGVANTPEWARQICEAALECKLEGSLHNKDGLKAAAETIRKIGERASEVSPDSADAWCATADGLQFRLRVLEACGEETKTEDWIAVTDALAKQHGLAPGDPAALERAVRCLREGQRADGTDEDVLKKREEELCAEGVKLFPKSALFLGVAQAAELDAIVALLAANGHKEAKPRLLSLIAAAADDTIYNDAITVAKEHSKKLGMKVEYRTREGKYGELLQYEVPKGERWRTTRDAITQYGRDGKLLRRFTLDYFERNINYTLGDTEYDGSNAKGMALISERDVLSVIVKTQRKSGIIKKALNRNITGVQYFVIGGWDKDADFTRFHTYLWKSDQRPWLTYRVWIIELKDLEGLDPGAQFVLDSFRETKYEGKER